MSFENSAGLYVFAAILLFVSHAVPSAPGVRDRLMTLLGVQLFRGLYSLVSLVVLVFFIWAYWGFDGGGWVYDPPAWSAPLAVVFMPLVFFLVLGRVMTPLGELQKPNKATGIYLLLRFPGSSGVLLWSLLHLAATGDLKRVVLFVTMAAISLYALLKNNWVLSKAETPEARSFRQTTSNLPLASLFTGKAGGRDLAGTGRPFLLAIVFYGLGLWLHPVVLGVDPLYWL